MSTLEKQDSLPDEVMVPQDPVLPRLHPTLAIFGAGVPSVCVQGPLPCACVISLRLGGLDVIPLRNQIQRMNFPLNSVHGLKVSWTPFYVSLTIMLTNGYTKRVDPDPLSPFSTTSRIPRNCFLKRT